ncbi:MAG: ABC transporter permease [Kiritimatiellae bacterium]|nr:ABC transporter permease [Kiritimatiellia bacterium]
MLKYAAKRILEAIPTTFGVLLLTFALFNIVGASPAETALGKNATAEAIEAFNKKYGYDKPLIFSTDSQFVNFVVNLAKGDLGYSVEYNEPVADVLKRGVGPSVSLALPILVFGAFAAIVFALAASACRGMVLDKGILTASTVLMSINYVVWVLAGQFLLSFKAGIFPIWGCEGAKYYILPVAIGVVSSLGMDIRFFRTAILDEMYKPYVLAARSKGLSSVRIMARHVLRNSLIPIVTYISLSIPYLFTGSLLLESFFGIPGLGSVSINAIQSSDMAVVRSVVVFGALIYQAVNILTDIAAAMLDPRVRLS